MRSAKPLEAVRGIVRLQTLLVQAFRSAFPEVRDCNFCWLRRMESLGELDENEGSIESGLHTVMESGALVRARGDCFELVR